MRAANRGRDDGRHRLVIHIASALRSVATGECERPKKESLC
jgi:hypothetical protein